MNIVEAYIKFNKKLILLISGMQGSEKNLVSKEISKILNIKCISLRNFINKNYKKEIKLDNGDTFIDWDNNDAYDWDEFNNYIEKHKSEGIIVYGFSFTQENVKFNYDFHINIKISKKNYIESRHKFLNTNKEKFNDLFKLINTQTESIMINKYIIPNYYKYLENSKINKFFNKNEFSTDEIIDQVFNYLITEIQKFINNYNDNLIKNKTITNKKIDNNEDIEYLEDEIAEKDSSESESSSDTTDSYKKKNSNNNSLESDNKSDKSYTLM